MTNMGILKLSINLQSKMRVLGKSLCGTRKALHLWLAGAMFQKRTVPLPEMNIGLVI